MQTQSFLNPIVLLEVHYDWSLLISLIASHGKGKAMSSFRSKIYEGLPLFLGIAATISCSQYV
jgi:hypothetical protein